MITMGNDEFILYVRKQHPETDLDNRWLGRKAWEWLRDHDSQARQLGEIACLWGDGAAELTEGKLPRTAMQFEFDAALLPQLYAYLDELARQHTRADAAVPAS